MSAGSGGPSRPDDLFVVRPDAWEFHVFGGRLRTRYLLSALSLGVLGTGLAQPVATARAEPGCGGAAGPMQGFVVEPGVLASRVAWPVKVGPGDTLGELAQRHLGSARFTADVLALNPGLDPRHVRVGMEVWMPPVSAARSPVAWVELFVVAAGGEVEPAEARDVGAVVAPWRVYPAGPVRVYAVPRSRVKDLLRTGGGRLREVDLAADGAVARSAPVEARAAGGRTIARSVTRVRVAGLSGRTLALDVLEQSLYSDTGHRLPLAAEATLEHGTLATPLLLVLAGLLIFGLVAWAARRMAAGAPGADASRP